MQRLKKLSKWPLVSIVTTCYNAQEYIEECIRSVLNQNYPHIEHIIEDGDSSDNTKKILKKYSKKYKDRIKIFSEPDNGQADGLNKALQKAQGEVLLVLNADDLILPHAVSWAVENFRRYSNEGVIYGDTYIINEKHEIISIKQAEEYNLEKLICVEIIPPAQAAFIRREALERVGYFIDVELDTCPDFELWVRIAQKYTMKHVFGIVSKYRHYKVAPPDSRRKRTVQRFVAAKKEVINRVLNKSSRSERIRNLKWRAYSGLYLWASKSAINLGDAKMGFFYLIISFMLRPTFRKLSKICKNVYTLSRLYLKSI